MTPTILEEPKKDQEIQSVHSSSTTPRESEEDDDTNHGPQYMSMTSKGDIEAYPVAINQPQNEKYNPSILATLTRTKSKASSWKDPGPPPDGGTKAWLQVVCGHLTVMSSWGLINSFGVFQTYYVTALGRPPSDIAWIGSFQVFLTFFIGTFTGRLTDAGYFRSVYLLGSFLSVFGLMMASLSTQYYQLFLAQGVLVGLGNGCIFCPMLALTSTYFSTKRSLAIGFAACGSASGGLIFPVMVQQLLPEIGFPWTMRALGLVVFISLAFCNVFARQRLPPRRTGAIVEWGAFKEATYTLFAIGMFLNFWGVYFAFFYIGSFARNIIGLPYTSSINLILVLNGVGFAGRLLPNFIADRWTGPLNIMIPITFGSSLIMYCMIAVTSDHGLYAWAVFYGILGAAIQSLFPAVLSSLTTDLKKAGVRMGMIFTIVSFAVLSGPPIAGALITSLDGRYLGAQLFSATSMLAAGCTLTAARVAKSGWVWRNKM